ncbi:hypothetical protein VTN00DRAFT_7379 [Thermoascus crustaceus]|uniref:uncharacterized protein n=1 Tax=Thermoascus crustaceus TaxID=5088 RepID=UPI003744184E
MLVTPPTGTQLDHYPRRRDRLYEEPTAKNSQGLFLPAACLFVGNLSTKLPMEKLAEDVRAKFSSFGRCHVKIKYDKKKGLPSAFIQFERVEHADAALLSNGSTMLHGRWLRIERAKGRRTAWLGLRSGDPISPANVLEALENKGPIEAFCIEPLPRDYSWTLVCIVTFAYVDDCKDAIRHFVADTKYYMILLPVDGSPLFPWVTVFHMAPVAAEFGATKFVTAPTPMEAAIEESHDKKAQKGGKSQFQPKTGRTIEDYVRCMAQELSINLNEEALLDVIEELEDVWKDKMLAEYRHGN